MAMALNKNSPIAKGLANNKARTLPLELPYTGTSANNTDKAKANISAS